MPPPQPRRLPPAVRAQAGLPFLTLPYLVAHEVTSIFDHCSPDYTQDGKICRFDGAVALKANGVDPEFPLGYALTPGKADYLYYDGHNGYDFGMSYEIVRAAAEGSVRLAGSDSLNPCFGQTIIIDHPNGFSSRYAHLSTVRVIPGEVVSRGQVIAVSGNTGCSSGPHLHFGVYFTASWTAIDPYGWSATGPDPWPYDVGNLWITGGPQYPLPWAPFGVTANPGDEAALVSWSRPLFDGGTPMTSYVVTPYIDGAALPSSAVSGSPAPISALVRGLRNGTRYTFTVSASNAVGTGPPSARSESIIAGDPSFSYWLAAADGAVFTFGNLTFYGSLGGRPLNSPVVGIARTPTDRGYWLAAADGGTFTFGDAGFYGSASTLFLNQPVVGMAATPTGRGYWLVAADGGIFTFGDAGFFGSTGALRLNQPVVGMAATPTGRGYWLVAADGGIFTFGDAGFYGSTGALRLNRPVVGMTATPTGRGYWLVAADGGIFTLGDAGFYGSTGALRLNQPMVGMARSRTGAGYWLVAADGGIFTFGDARFNGSTGGMPINQPLVGMATG